MWYYIFMINILTFILLGLDKSSAERRQYRISEILLLTCGFLGGGIGGLLGMCTFNHKIRKTRFYAVYLANTLLALLYLMNYFKF